MSWQTILPYALFLVFVGVMLAIDLGVFHRKSHTVSIREAGIWTMVWVSLACLFAAGLWVRQGSADSLAFIAGYIIEYSLSMDNIFVFVLIFTFFAVPPTYQHRILFWGILGALVMRGIMIGVGAALIDRFHWIIYIFGAFLVFTGVRMAFHNDDEVRPDQNPVIRLFTHFIPVSRDYDGDRFFTWQNGRRMATPLAVVLVMVESTDLIFAVDSIPAIFAVTTDPFLIFTSNVFAILGLRSLYFVLRGAIDKFHYLKLGLAAVLTFVGAKMLLGYWFHLPIQISLAIIGGLLAVSVLASLLRPRPADEPTERPADSLSQP